MENTTPHRVEKGHIRPLYLFLPAILFLILGVVSSNLNQEGDRSSKDAAKFQRAIHQKESFLKQEFRTLEALFTEESPTSVLDRKSSEYQELAAKRGISIFYYEGGSLKYWSDHSIPVFKRWRQRFARPFLPMRNADYVSVVSRDGRGVLLGLIEIRTHFPFQNEFLINGFHSDFKLDNEVQIEFLENSGTQSIVNENGAYLFSLDFSETSSLNMNLGIFSIVCFVLFVVLLLSGFYALVRTAEGKARWNWSGLITVLILGIVVTILKFGYPAILTDSYLFQPELFASRFFPSLGHLLLLSGALLYLTGLFYFHGNLKQLLTFRNNQTLGGLLFCGATILLLITEHLISILVLDSSISFQAHNVTTFSIYTFLGLFIITMWIVMLVMVLDIGYAILSGRPGTILAIGGAAITITMLIAYLLPGHYGSWIGWGAMMLMLGGLLYLRYHHAERVPFSRFIFLLLFISVFMVVRLQESNQINVEREREVELVKLSSEHDPVAEMLFSELTLAIRNDSVLARYLNLPFIPIDQVVDRLRRNYLSGYWTKYDLQITVCRPDDRVYLEPPDDEFHHCYTFFEEMVTLEGIQIANSDFYFLDNLNGRISYLASIPYYLAESEHRVYIELDSKILSEELGYPELLLDKQNSSFTKSKYPYAKYNNDTLITQDGAFPYRRTSSYYTSGAELFEKITIDKYDHSIYNVDERNTIIVGSPSVTHVDHLISFSYIFALNFLILGLVYMGLTMRLFRPKFNWNFKNRIQYSMVGILFLTFVLICSGTIFFIIQQYKAKHNDTLRNTMRSVYIELVHKVEFEENLRNWSSESYYDLDELLRKFSNVFYSDINLYDEAGDLLATSRAEIFDRQLLSRRMNRLVFESLSGGNASEFIHNEHIGEMRYISAYVPLLNNENKFLAYLNLPYFTQSGALTKDVTNLVVAVINIYMILLLVIIVVSVFLADRITQPLRMIQHRIAQVSLSAKNEMIRYERSDEIRGLVEEYNYMVEELERSAGLLALSERESAWREMAKQIAHEIKNPLTPMKLNVQHLQRTIEEGKDDAALVERISATLIEQIDSLSAIANEFSDFAKMPKAKNARINLVTKLKNLLQLFETSEKTRFDLDLGSLSKVYIFADKEQLMRVFINLVKNGLQSIPEDRKGSIKISLKLEDEHAVLVTISDNGKGIPDEIRDKLFQPNFTTKSGGMGMGLAISYNIVRSLGGKIWYETAINKGTVFFVQLPLMVDKS